MKIAVLVKQVPATTEVKVDPVTHNLVREGVRSAVNPFDLYAIEEALRLRDKCDAELVAVSMGPPQAANALKYCLALGFDQAVLVSDRAFAGSDTWATALVLSAAMSRIRPDLILCGKMASDGDTAQVPPELAEHLGMPCVTLVSQVDSVQFPGYACSETPGGREGPGEAVVWRALGDMETQVAVTLPAVLTIEKGANTPRFPTLQGLADILGKPVESRAAADLDLDVAQVGAQGSPTQVVQVMPAKSADRGVVLQGPLEEQLRRVIEMLKKAGVLGRENGGREGAAGHE